MVKSVELSVKSAFNKLKISNVAGLSSLFNFVNHKQVRKHSS